MPKTLVIFFREKDGKAPVVAWLADLMKTNAKAWANCRAKIEMLAQFGHELRRPAADFLRDGIHELRAKQGHVQYRILYFFTGETSQSLRIALRKKTKCRIWKLKRRLRERNCSR
jgi:hypothetical protein